MSNIDAALFNKNCFGTKDDQAFNYEESSISSVVPKFTDIQGLMHSQVSELKLI